MGQAIFVVGYELILVAEVQVVAEPLLEMAMVSGWNSPIGQQDTVVVRQGRRYAAHWMLSSFPDNTHIPVLSR